MRVRNLCPEIKINRFMERTEIIQTVLDVFIKTENNQRGRGVQFWYPVETLPMLVNVPETKPIDSFLLNTNKLFIKRPGGLQKWNFDFKVIITPEMCMVRGTHADVVNDVINKKRENPNAMESFLLVLTIICNCDDNDVDKILAAHPNLLTAFGSGARVDVLLKVLKWMFVMEDIVYWNYDGRMKLFNHIKEQVE